MLEDSPLPLAALLFFFFELGTIDTVLSGEIPSATFGEVCSVDSLALASSGSFAVFLAAFEPLLPFAMSCKFISLR